ncbi:hypothetical protein [Tortoise microvirus 36]|nr:hypothetical protein [Tortoise microvirus 36]
MFTFHSFLHFLCFYIGVCMFDVDTSDGSILPSGRSRAVDVTILFPESFIDAIDNLLLGDTMSLPDFIRLACVEYFISTLMC